MNNEQRRSRRNRVQPARQRMVDPDAWTPDGGPSPQPTTEELPSLPLPTPSTSSSGSITINDDDDASQPLVTQPADPVAAAIARRQNTVVTVTSTQFSGVNPNVSSSQDSGLPIVTIAVSASVGVFLAVSIVGCWWWFCKRPYTRRRKPSARPSHKNQTSTSSVAPLNSSYRTKTGGQSASPRSREKLPGPTTTTTTTTTPPHSHTRSTSGGPPNGKERQQQQQGQQQRRPGQPAIPPAAVLPPSSSAPPSSTTNTPPNSKRRSPPGQSSPSHSGRSPSLSDSSAPSSPASTLVDEPSSSSATTTTTPGRRPGSGGNKSYAPQKPSPLALGAERAKPKEKPKEKTKVNEWGTGYPVSNTGHSSGNGSAPSSPTRSSSSGHGRQESAEQDVPPPVPPVPATTAGAFNAGRQSANMLAIPEPAAQFHSRRDRISVLSDSSYYALDPDEEDGARGGGAAQHVYMGVALGGDEPSPIPEEYFSPNYGEEEEEEERGGRMQRQQESYFSSQSASYGGYGQHQQRQQQSYSQPYGQQQQQRSYTQPYGQQQQQQSYTQPYGQQQQQQSYSQPQPSQYRSQGGYGYGYGSGYSSNSQSYRR